MQRALNAELGCLTEIDTARLAKGGEMPDFGANLDY
jgi:hypothetical protein